MLFTACAALLSSLLFGFSPALRLTRVSVNEKLKAAPGKGIAGGTPHRLMRGLPVVSQIALAFVLLVGSGLLVKSFIRLHQVQLGFEPRNLMTMQAALTSEKYRTADAAWEFQHRVLDRLATAPGVLSTATVSSLPMERGLNVFFRVTGSDAPGRLAEFRPISPDYFRTMGIPALRGRTFTDDDMRSATLAVIVNQHLASLFWPTEDPLGHELSFDKRQWKIIGVVSNIREKGLNKPLEPTVYVPMARISDEMAVSMNRWFLTTWLVRTAGPIDVGAQLRDAIREVDPQIPVANIRPMNEVVSASVASQRFVVFLMGIFASSALFLTAVGLYGVLSYQVSQRKHEIGVRMALGARPRHVMKLIVGQGLLLAVIGICLGVAGSLAGTRVIANLLFGVSVTDPATYVSITVLLSVIALLDCYFPARRAMKLDPASTLRQE
jgi:putative ABC transport system permease protein